jgi:hypothetical protein
MMKVSPTRPVPARSVLIVSISSCDRGAVDSGVKCVRFLLLGFAMGVTQGPREACGGLGTSRMVMSSSGLPGRWGRVGACMLRGPWGCLGARALGGFSVNLGGGSMSSIETRRL